MRMKEGLPLPVAVFIALFATGALSYPGIIFRGPETQTTAAIGTKTFVCTAQGDVLWYIDDRWLSNSYKTILNGKGISFRETRLSGIYPTANLTMTVPARDDLNGTEIHCRTAGSDGIIVFSNYSWLRIVGPPLPPNASLELTSWDTLTLYWDPPFTHDGFPIEKYIVFTTNSSSEGRTETTLYPTADASNESLIITDTPSLCHTLTLEVVAQSSAGKSSAFEISGGFPIAAREFSTSVSVVFLESGEDLVPQATISFQPPEVCSSDTGVLAVYGMELRGESGGLVFRVGGEYHESELMEETLTLASCSSYSLSVTVSLPSFPQLGSHTNTNTFNVSHGCPSTPTAATKRDSADNVLLPVLIGVTAIVLLTLAIGAGVVCVCYLRQRKRKTVNMRRLRREADNPIYDGSHLYDVIPEPYCEAKPLQPATRLKKQTSSDFRYSTTPAPLPTGNKELYGQPSPSFYQNSFSPDSPNPREVDAILRNTFAGSLSPLSQRCEGGRGGGEGVAYDTLREGEETRESNNEDSYVLMQSSLV